MHKTERLQKIEAYIMENKYAAMEELCEVFRISMNTLRSDVSELVAKGSVKKVYGGVCIDTDTQYTSFYERDMINVQAKKDISKTAAKFIEENDIIFIDSGSTTQFIIDYLNPSITVTILTSSLTVINKIANMENVTLICLEGSYQRKTNSFLFINPFNQMQKYNINKAFMSASGISETGNLTNSSMAEYEVKKAAIKCSSKNYLLADSSKTNKTALLTFATIDEMTALITDSKVSESFLEICKDNNVNIIFP